MSTALAKVYMKAQNLLAKSKSYSVVQQTALNAEKDHSILKDKLRLLNELEQEAGTIPTYPEPIAKVIASAENSSEENSSDEDIDRMGPDQEFIQKNGSIAERLALLKNNGENNWRKRVTKKEVTTDIKRENFVGEVLSSVASKENELPKVQLRHVKSVEGGNISDRLSMIKNNSEKWKNRVEPSDAANFKISNDEIDDPPELPFIRNDTKKSPPLHIFKSDKMQSFKLSKSTSTSFGFGKSPLLHSAMKEKKLFSRSLSVQEENMDAADSAPELSIKSFKKQHLKVQLPTLDDDGFHNFFPKASEIITPISVDVSDFDEIKTVTAQLSHRKLVQGPKRRRPVQNPVKTLAHLRTDVKEYTELIVDESPSSSETKDKKSKFAAEALAGLASVEDFASVSLKSSHDPLVLTHLPYKSPMLLHIKGRRHVQVRLVEPKFSSLNNGDCFILVTTDKLFNFIGRYANVIEQKICKDMCMQIVRDKDLGCVAMTNIMVNDKNIDGYNGKIFCKVLNRHENENLINAGHSDEDELFESCLIETTKVYEYRDYCLMPVENFWGQVLTISAIDSKKIFVFDFGSECYVWYGKHSLPDSKKIALLLAEELFELPFDYSMCNVNPVNYATVCGHRKDNIEMSMQSNKRPNWTLLAKVNQNMETVLFREKFLDWPDIKIQFKSEQSIDCNDIEAIDGAQLYRSYNYEEPNLILEGCNLGRGNFYYDNETRRHFDIISVSIKKWHATESDNQEVPEKDFVHFYSTESYTIRWIYQISITVRELSGRVSNRSTVGRDRCVYFNWQGKDSSASERGTATLHMVELDKEKGAQMIIQQHYEMPAFLRLFQIMFIHKQRKNDEVDRYNSWRMYYVNGNDNNESVAVEVKCCYEQMRSRACLILLHGKKKILMLWRGCKASDNSYKIAKNVCDRIQIENYTEFYPSDGVKYKEITEGTEDKEFFSAVGGNDENDRPYNSLLKTTDKYDFTPRMYEFTSKNGSFEAIEVIANLRTADEATVFPFVQSDLYDARQPKIFLIDNGYSLYLWQGWWPKQDEPQDTVDNVNNVENRAGENRWHLSRVEAMQTAVDYWKTKYEDNDKYCDEAFIITAGYEPVEFQNIFPEWNVNNDIVEINSQNSSRTQIRIKEYLSKFQQTEYPLDIIMQRPLPETLNATRLEQYLSDEDFQQVLGMCKDEFKKLPSWKKTNLKKEKRLF